MLRTYRAYNPTTKFSVYEFNNKLLGGVIFLELYHVQLEPHEHGQDL